MKEFSKGGKQTEAHAEVVSVSTLSETRGRRLDPIPPPPPSPENISLCSSHYTLVQHILNKSFLKRDASPAFLSRVCHSEGNFLVL